MIVVVALPVYFIWEPVRRTDAEDAFDDASVERGAVLFANDQLGGVRHHQVAAVRRLPRRRRRRRHRAVRRSQPEPDECDRPSDEPGADPDVPECLPQQVAWAAPDAHTAPLRYDRGAAHPDHHLRPAGHADAGVGRAERQGRAERAGHPRPRRTTSRASRSRPRRRRQRGTKALTDYQQGDAQEREARATAPRMARPTLTRRPQARRRGTTRRRDRDAPRRDADDAAAGRARERPTTRYERRRSRADRRRDPVPAQLRPLPHEGLVVLRPDQPAGVPAAGTAWAAAPTARTSPAATSTAVPGAAR